MLLMLPVASTPFGRRLLGLPPAQGPTASLHLVELGRTLFFDPALSAEGTVSCATCHDAERALSDGKPVAIGNHGRQGTRNTPSLLNAAFTSPFSWDGRRRALEEQVLDPFTNPNEHGLGTRDEILERVRASTKAVAALKTLAGREASRGPVSLGLISRALAAYVRSLAAGDSAFDRYQYLGQSDALSDSQRRGLGLFKARARCIECHLVGPEAATFTDGQFHPAGSELPDLPPRLADLTMKLAGLPHSRLNQLVTEDSDVAALGRFVVTLDPKDIGTFRTPSLRNVAVTAPYMHDGTVTTLADAVDRELYYRGVERPIVLTPSERTDLLAFLGSLTSATPDQGSARP